MKKQAYFVRPVFRLSICLVSVVGALLPGLVRASATLGAEGQVFATGGNVIVDVLSGTTSGVTSTIRFYPDYPDMSTPVFIGIDGQSGTVDLGAQGLSFSQGEELVFGIDNDQAAQYPTHVLVMGPASRNFDGYPHARVSEDSLSGEGVVESFRVDFEDIPGAGANYNDAFIRIRQTAPAASLDDGLVAHYPFSSDADDASGNDNHGVVHGATLTTDRFGNADSAYSFDGSNDYILSSTAFAQQNRGTISFWVKAPSGGSIGGALISSRSTSGYESGDFFITGDAEGKIGVAYWATSGWETMGGAMVASDEWTHIAISWDSGDVARFYVGGSSFLEDATEVSYPLFDGLPLMFGNDQVFHFGSWVTDFGRGELDDVRIYNRALSAEEVSGLYQQSDPTCNASTDASDLFESRTTHGVDYYPMDVALGDINNDGNEDAVVTSDINNFFRVLLGQGNGSFSTQSTYGTEQRPESIALGDLNNDGNLDAVTTGDDGPDSVSVLLGYGNGSFASRSTYGVGPDPKTVTLADLDNDGTLDVLTSNGGDSTVSVLLGQGNGSFASAVSYAGGGSIAAGDLDGDGVLDLVSNYACDTPATAKQWSGNGHWYDLIGNGLGGSDLHYTWPDAKADAEARGGYLATTTSAEEWAFLKSQMSTWQPETVWPNGGGTYQGWIGAFQNTSSPSYSEPGGGWEWVTGEPFSYTAWRAGEPNNSGGEDYVLTWFHAAEGWGDFVNYGESRYYIEYDSLPDCEAGSQTIAVRLGQGDGTFGGATSYTGSGAVALGDIDGDGALDVVVSNESAQTVSVLRGVGDGTLEEATTSSSNGGRIAPLADLNGDGVLDVAVGYYNASTSLTALLGQCDGSLGSQGDYDIGSQPRSLALGDLNGDGAPDLAAPNYGSHTISVLLGVPASCTDTDGDGVCDEEDNCPAVSNADQANYDGDTEGDVCDADDDNDGVPDTEDAFPFDSSESVDTDGDGIGNNADLDDDNDGFTDVQEAEAGTDPLDAESKPGIDYGLVAHYPFAGNADDASGSGNHGVVEGATLTADRFGVADESYEFDGVDDYISIATELSGYAEFTYSGWIRLDADEEWTDGQVILQTATGSLSYDPSGEVLGLSIIEDRAGGTSGLPSTGHGYHVPLPVSKGEWFHLSFIVKSDNTGRLYINGAEVSAGERWTDHGGNGLYPATNIGVVYDSKFNSHNGFFSGVLDGVRIHSRALSAEEVADLYFLNPVEDWTVEQTPADLILGHTPTPTAWSVVEVEGEQAIYSGDDPNGSLVSDFIASGDFVFTGQFSALDNGDSDLLGLVFDWQSHEQTHFVAWGGHEVARWNGHYHISRRDGDSDSDLVKVQSNWTPTRWYDFSVEKTGSTYRIRILSDGSVAHDHTFTDETFGSGRVGIHSTSQSVYFRRLSFSGETVVHSENVCNQGEIVSWGRDNGGQVSDTPTGDTFVSIAGGGAHSLALTADGSIISWGYDDRGQVSDTPTGSGFIAIAAGTTVYDGGGHSLALTADGSIVSWGNDDYGQVSNTPSGTGFTAIAAGRERGMALAADGSIVSWGNDLESVVSDTPTGSGFTAIGAGEHHSLALAADGSIVSWGRNAYGEVSGTPAGSGFVAIAAGGYHSMALAADGSIVAWARNSNGQVSNTPTEAGFIAIAAGVYHGLALAADGSILSWGNDVNGQVGETPGGTGFTAIAAGVFHSLALHRAGSVADVCDAGDADGDGVPDTSDNCPETPNADQANYDGDTEGDVCDSDDDNDGVPDTEDAFPFDSSESVDTDGDGIGNNADLDDDNDGFTDVQEAEAGTDPLDAQSTPGQACTSLSFDADGGRVLVPAESIPSYGDEYTIEAWFRIDRSLDDNYAYLINHGWGTTENAFTLQIDSELNFEWLTGSGSSWAVLESTPVVDRVWHHVAAVFDHGTTTLFLDGEIVSQTSGRESPGSRAASERLSIAGVGDDPVFLNDAGPYSFPGWIDEVRLSRVARYQGPFVPSKRHAMDEDSVLLLHFDEGLGSTTLAHGAPPSYANAEFQGPGVLWSSESACDARLSELELGPIVQITDNQTDDEDVAISSGGLVWESCGGELDEYGSCIGGDDIVFWDGASSDVIVLQEGGGDDPDISENRVVWTWCDEEDPTQPCDGGSSDLFFWDGTMTSPPPWPSVPVVTHLYQGAEGWDLEPAISGNKVVWDPCESVYDEVNRFWSCVTDREILLLDVEEGPQWLTSNETPDYSPVIAGDAVAWVGCDEASSCEVYLWRDGEVAQITEDGSIKERLAMSETTLAWISWDDDFVVGDLYVWDGSVTRQITQGVTALDPSVSGDYVVWEACELNSSSRCESVSQIYLWDGEGITQVTNSEAGAWEPDIDGDTIVWHACDGVLAEDGYNCEPSPDDASTGDREIYMAKIPEPTSGLLQAAALLTLAGLGMRRRG